ncbi:MAG: AMP-binding protein [Flavobacteriales bacterium]|nr:AMP-binding protein [Flavobacteriales bacterium]
MQDYQSPLEMLYRWENESPNKLYMRQPINDEWHKWTWSESATEVRKMAAYLQSLDLAPKSKIAILSKNCAHWIISDLAIMMAGHVSVPLYPNLKAESIKQILDHSETKLVFVGKLDDFASMRPGIPKDMPCIAYPFYSEEGYPVWGDVIKDVEPISENVIREPKDLATIIYTSGTTGMPKGVMHKFYNFSFATSNAVPLLGLATEERFFSYLPLCHIAERLLVEMGSLYSGGMVSFAESLDTFAKNLSDTKPTAFLGVPRIWTKFQQGILTKLPQKKLNILLAIPGVSSLIKKKIKSGLGLQEARNVFTGAAPTPVSTLKWFKRLGINIQEAYAMTENCCYSHVTLNDDIQFGFVGKALPHCEVKLSEKNEILIKHVALMDGYYKEEKQTQDTIKDGWLYTGDEGHIDSKGFLKITGRVKDLFKTSKAKYVAPAPIEMKLSANKNIEQVCVVGENIPQPIALVTLSEYGKSRPSQDVVASLSKTLSIVNPKFDAHERLKKIIVLDQEWTIENNLLTPSMKIKRNEVEKLHKDNYVSWYERVEEVIW